MKYAWVIDVDHIADESFAEGTYSNAKGVEGPRDAPQHLLDRLHKGEGFRFRMKDDDLETYYDGRILFDEPIEVEVKDLEGFKAPIASGNLPEEAFGPLDDFGMPNAGAVHIFYFDKQGKMGAL